MLCQYLTLMIFNSRNLYKILLLITIIVVKPYYLLATHPLNTITNSEVVITSDSLNLDNNNLFASFKGSVAVAFEDFILKTDRLKIYYANSNNKKSIKKIEIPNHLKIIRKFNDEVVIADSAEYIVSLNKLTLKGNVRAEKDKNILIADKMIYFTKLKSGF